MAFTVEIVSAERSIWSGEAEFVVVPGSQGELGIHKGHAPLITYLKPGTVQVSDLEGAPHLFFVSGGVLEVQPTSVIVLADVSSRADELDEAAILEAKAEAEAMREKAHREKLSYAEIDAKLSMMMSQLSSIEKYRSSQK